MLGWQPLAVAEVPPAFLTRWGAPGADPGNLNRPTGIATDASGCLYVPDSGNHRIQVFDADGNFLREWGTTGTGPGEFFTLFDVAVAADGTVYALDLLALQAFDAQGNFLSRFPVSFTTTAVAVHPTGVVYVARIDRIQELDAAGLVVHQWGSPGSGNGEFNGVRDLAFDASGMLYVVDSGNSRIQKFDAQGNFRPRAALR
jgi:DNA-binding beta-propeller fold protein YncE